MVTQVLRPTKIVLALDGKRSRDDADDQELKCGSVPDTEMRMNLEQLKDVSVTNLGDQDERWLQEQKG